MKTSKLYVFLFFFLLQFSLNAQQVNTLYFMRDIPVRHYLNPAFQPTNDFYISLPVIGFTQFDLGNNSLSIKDLIYKVNGQTILFLNPAGNVDQFYNRLKINTVLRTDLQTNLLSFGFRHNLSYWSFSLSEKIDGTSSVPKDLFKLALYGTPDVLSNSFRFTNLQSEISIYSEAALGYSTELNNKWLVGGKLKFLYGSANVSVTNSQINLYAGADNWNLKGNGVLNMSSPFQMNIGPDFQPFSFTAPTTLAGWLKPAGIGAAIDLGVEYKLNKSIRLSAAITDLGFINWKRNLQNYNYGIDFTFKGLKQFNNTTTTNTLKDFYNQLTSNLLVDSISKAFKSALSTNLSTNPYTTGTSAKLNLGFEYAFLNDKVSLGFLSHSRFSDKTVTEDLTASVNTRPKNWLDASLSYSILNGRFSTIGAGVGVRTGFLHWFVAADYLATQKITITAQNIAYALPYNSTYMNFSAGVNIVFDSEINKAKRIKNEIAEKSGLKNTNQNLTRKTAVVLPDKKKITQNRTRIKSNGLIRKKAKQDCNCDWN
jgi:hypothetical protein